jgi:hypothetical protein
MDVACENAADSKTGMGLSVHRGFESPLSVERGHFLPSAGETGRCLSSLCTGPMGGSTWAS